MAIHFTCPICRTEARDDNRFCHVCGYDFDERRKPTAGPSITIAEPREVELSAWSGFKFGIGFAIGVLFVTVVLAVLGSALFASVVRTFTPGR